MKQFRLLCIDDDPLALDQVRQVIAECALPVAPVYVGSPRLALERYAEEPFDLVLSDLRLGTTTGLKLITKLRALYENAIFMLLSGDADLESALKAVNEADVFRFFTKPATRDGLKLGLSEAILEFNLREMRRTTSSMLGALDSFSAAICSVTSEGQILYANGAASELIENSGYFKVNANNELRSANAEESKAFRAFLKSVLENASAPCRSVFRFSPPSRTEPIVVSAIRDESAPDQINLLISDPARPVGSVEDVRAALGLTPSEARVVHGLVRGGSVDEAAELAGVSINSARTYLKHAFAKAGVSRQAELVRLAILAVT